MNHILGWITLRAVDAEDIVDAEQIEQTLDELIDDSSEPQQTEGDIEPPEETPREKRLRERAEKAERDAKEAREVARRPAPAPESSRPPVDPEYEAEERELQQLRTGGATAEQMAWAQWKVDQTRKIRSSERNSARSVALAEDAADRAQFERLEFTKPQWYKRYHERVEQAVEEWRSKGQNVPRMAILRVLIGDDMMKGNLKTKARAAPAAASEGMPVQRVPRDLTPRARTDVAKRGKLSRREELYARLENQII